MQQPVPGDRRHRQVGMSVLIPGDTCWRIARARRAAFLVDTEAYFTAVFEVLRKARRSVTLLGWGFDPRTRLFPDGEDGPDDPDEVGRILIELARARPELEIRLLIWKSALPISASQEFFPHRARKWFENTPVQFRLDDSVPIGACHHQKVLVVDDAVAFCGGGDIGVDRWDTPGHLDGDRRRMMPDHECHDPRHEVMMLVDGEAAHALGDLARARWRKATGEMLRPCKPTDGDPWPAHLPAHLTDVDIAIARTEPAWKEQVQVEEIRRLTQASIQSARKTIYLENQYFTSPLIAEALAACLGEPDGPEIVLVSTGQSPSWFDRLTMDRARSNMLWRLQAADIFGRFRAFYPITPLGQKIIVHSKTAVFDDVLARVGSANLNNRSGGFDTECELAVEATTEAASRAIAAFRDRSIGHFLGCTGDAVAKARQEMGGLIPAIDYLNRQGRLSPILPKTMTPFGEFIAACHLGDPVNASDSWRLGRRRERLYLEARALGEGGLFHSRDWKDPLNRLKAP
jgi:phosphatidylserine/phosphatidylglycerophosphate/cardiolipin synthase-like enzyme